MDTCDFSPTRPEFFLGDADAAFERLRSEDPVHWHADAGFWCVTRHAHVMEVSKLPRVYSSEHGTQIFQIPTPGAGAERGLGEQIYPEGMTPSVIQMDPPRHNRHRKLAIGAFTPRRVAALEPLVRDIARKSLERVPRGVAVDFVEDVAIPLPMWVIAEMLGVPPELQHEFRRWSDATVEVGGGGFDEDTAAAVTEFMAFLHSHVAERRRAPRSDVISQLIQAAIDGDRLNDSEVVMFALTLLVAGNETTRNLVSGGALALSEHPQQWDRLLAEPTLLPNAIEEMLRWVSPVRTFVRRALVDTRLGNTAIAAGDYLVLFYGSANRDEEVFGPDAARFDIARADARRHLAFGFGEHLCLGAALARLEARVLFEELFARLPRFELVGEVERLPSILMNGIVRMPVRFAA